MVMLAGHLSTFGWGGSALTIGGIPGGPPPTTAPQNVYVSTSGNDANDGLSSATPKQTIAAGKALMRHGIGDHLLLKRGDTFTVSNGFGDWTTSGASPLRPQIIGAYGIGEIPIVRSDTGNGLNLSGPVNFLRVENIDFTAHSYNGSSGTPAGIKVSETADYLTITGCVIRNFADGIRFDPPVIPGHTVQHVSVHQNVIQDIYSSIGNPSAGVYCSRLYFSSIDDNVFSKIGEVTPGVNHHGVLVRSGSSYNCSDNNVDNNLFMEIAGTAILNRSSRFNARNNMIAKAAIAIANSGLDPVNGFVEGMTRCECRENCITQGRDTNGSTPRGWGFTFEHISDNFDAGGQGVTWHNNLMVDHGTSTDPHPFIIEPAFPNSNGTRVRRVRSNGNRIYEWQGSCKTNHTYSAQGDFRSSGHDNSRIYSTGSHYVWEHNSDNGGMWDVGACHFISGASSGARYRYNGVDMNQATWATHIGNGAGGTDEVIPAGSWPDPTRTISTYCTVVGGDGTFAGFVTLARAQRQGTWRPELGGAAVATWIRQGFGFS